MKSWSFHKENGVGPGPRIAIVGGGQSARWLLFSILNEVISGERALGGAQITIIEARREFATGRAWSRDFALDEHFASTSAPLSRCMYGDAQQQQFNTTVEMLRSHGISVTLLPGCRAVGIHQHADHSIVLLASGESVACDALILATGHDLLPWCGGAPALRAILNHPRVHSSPWPAQELADRIFCEPSDLCRRGRRILILGSYLTAIDAVMTLALRAGQFRLGNESTIQYSAPSTVRFALASRSGKLPRVWVYTNDGSYSPEFFTAARLQDLRRNSPDGFLPLNDTVTQLFREMLRATGHYLVDTSRIGSAIRAWRRWFQRTSPESMLREDLLVASMNTPQTVCFTPSALRWQIAIDDALQVWSEASIGFSAEDQLIFDDTMRTSFFAHLLPMTPSVARQVDAMIRSGHLEILTTGREYSVQAASHGGVVLTDSNCLRHEFTDVVDATGSSIDILRNPSPLMRSLLQNRAIQPALRRFQDNRRVLGLPKEVMRLVTWDRGAAFLQATGVHVDHASCLVIPSGASEWSPIMPRRGARLYAMGPLLSGHFTDAQSLGQVQRDATRITTDLSVWWPCRNAGTYVKEKVL